MARITVDLRLLATRMELSGLHEALEIMERQVRFLTQQRKLQAEADLKELAGEGAGWEDPEVQLAIQERNHAVEHLYPRLVRGPFLVTLWAIYEAGLKEVARFVQHHKGIDLDIDEIKGGDIRKRARRYFEAVLCVDFPSDSSRAGTLGKLYRVRNAFAHANGRLRGLKGDARQTVDSLIAEGQLEESLGYIIPTKAYVTVACDVVNRELSSLVEGTIAWHDGMKAADKRVG